MFLLPQRNDGIRAATVTERKIRAAHRVSGHRPVPKGQNFNNPRVGIPTKQHVVGGWWPRTKTARPNGAEHGTRKVLLRPVGAKIFFGGRTPD